MAIVNWENKNRENAVALYSFMHALIVLHFYRTRVSCAVVYQLNYLCTEYIYTASRCTELYSS